MSQIIKGSTPAEDGFYMPAEFSPQDEVFMVWPERTDNWRNGAKPAQAAYARVAKAISEFTPVTMMVSTKQFAHAREILPPEIRVVEVSTDDAWCRDTGPTFVIDGKGHRRAIDWTFNAWGGLVDGLYFPWNQDDMVAGKVCEMTRTDRYRTDDFVLEGGSIHVDGEGTVLTTEMCLLSPGRNPDMTREEIEEKLCGYLNCEKVIWLKDGIDPYETNGHIDDVACFIAPGEVACIWTDDSSHPFYKEAQAAYRALSQAVDAKGRKLKVHKLTLTAKPILLEGADTIDRVPGTAPRQDGDLCIASYMNFLITNSGVIVPQYEDENDQLALEQIQAMFPHHKVVGVDTREIVYGGGNIHCITQQMPSDGK
ncbi:agmatine deiminase [Allisonella histaminiformans]|uniref:agmatine deiminase n=1 Tax=Allisonella histaminiformans TaxID=209880 RepID=UPI00307BE48C